MIAALARFPARWALLIATVVALPVAMWSALPFGSSLMIALIVQAVGLARAFGLEPSNDPVARKGDAA